MHDLIIAGNSLLIKGSELNIINFIKSIGSSNVGIHVKTQRAVSEWTGEVKA